MEEGKMEMDREQPAGEDAKQKLEQVKREQDIIQQHVRSLLAQSKYAEAFQAADSMAPHMLPCLLGPGRYPWKDFTGVEKTILLEALPFVLATAEATVQLIRAVGHLLVHNVPGAFVECGVYKGGGAIAMIRAYQYAASSAPLHSREFWLYDTFAGFPKPEAADYEYGIGPAVLTWHKHKKEGDASEDGSDWLNCPQEEVEKTITALGYSSQRIKIIKGMVENTIPREAPEQIALLHLDTDFYRSTKHELTHLYPRISPGGIVMFDDYGALHGSRTATDEYFAEQKIPMLLARVDEHVRLGVKI